MDEATATKTRLAAELRIVAKKAGPANSKAYHALADRAETGEFDDYADVHLCGPTALYYELKTHGFDKFAHRVADGEFDATLDESEEWTRSQTDPETVAIMQAMGLGADRAGDE